MVYKNLNMRIQHRRGTYKEFLSNNAIFLDGEIIIVTQCPWYKSWFGLKPTRLVIGDGKTEFKKLKFI